MTWQPQTLKANTSYADARRRSNSNPNDAAAHDDKTCSPLSRRSASPRRRRRSPQNPKRARAPVGHQPLPWARRPSSRGPAVRRPKPACRPPRVVQGLESSRVSVADADAVDAVDAVAVDADEAAAVADAVDADADAEDRRWTEDR